LEAELHDERMLPQLYDEEDVETFVLQSRQQRCSPMRRTGFQGPTEKKMNENVKVLRPAENLVHQCMGELRRR
jgi:hypothetical protein